MRPTWASCPSETLRYNASAGEVLASKLVAKALPTVALQHVARPPGAEILYCSLLSLSSSLAMARQILQLRLGLCLFASIPLGCVIQVIKRAHASTHFLS